jgi:NAD(P)-dependent dehydrogenase (short-subunit alcohol dehydrogenase family)
MLTAPEASRAKEQLVSLPSSRSQMEAKTMKSPVRAGVAFATAERFARAGRRVAFSNRILPKGRELADGLKASATVPGPGAAIPPSLRRSAVAIADVREAGPIQVIHYNAASNARWHLRRRPGDTFGADLAIDIGGVLVAAQAAGRQIGERGPGTARLIGAVIRSSHF